MTKKIQGWMSLSACFLLFSVLGMVLLAPKTQSQSLKNTDGNKKNTESENIEFPKGPILLQENFQTQEELSKWILGGTTSLLRKEAILEKNPEGGPGSIVHLSYDFTGGGGFLSFRKPLQIELPEDYLVQFDLKGEGQTLDLECNLMDETGKNVWRRQFLQMTTTKQWQVVSIKKSDFERAWGPNALALPLRLSGIALVTVVNKNGPGQYWLRNIRLIDTSYKEEPQAKILSPSIIEYDFGQLRSFGGASIQWGNHKSSEKSTTPITIPDFKVEASKDRKKWLVLSEFHQQGEKLPVNTISTDIPFPGGVTTRHLKLEILNTPQGPQKSTTIASETATTIAAGPSIVTSPAKKTAKVASKTTDTIATRAKTKSKSLTTGGGKISAFSTATVENIKIKFYSEDLGKKPIQFLMALAKNHPPGVYPKYLYGHQTQWTTVPMPDTLGKIKKSERQKSQDRLEVKEEDPLPSVFNEEGFLEVGMESITIEPSLSVDGHYVTWADVPQISQHLVSDYLPIPISKWSSPLMDLEVTAFTQPQDDWFITYLRYKVKSTSKSKAPQKILLNASLRPIPVTPVYQDPDPNKWMNRSITHLEYDGEKVLASVGPSENFYLILPLIPKSNKSIKTRFGAQSFFQGPLYDNLSKGELPKSQSITENLSALIKPSGVFQFAFDLEPQKEKEIYLSIVTLPQSKKNQVNRVVSQIKKKNGPQQFAMAKDRWTRQLNLVQWQGPAITQKMLNTYKTALAHIQGNRKGWALEPGPRRYTSSWIRDGAFMASALLGAGISDLPKKFAQWYSGFQRDNGFFPCCITVNREEPPYVEYDSNGQFIFLISEIYHFTGDRLFVQRMWPKVEKSVDFIQTLRQKTMTKEYQTDPEKKKFFGLLPPSVSHEGYLGHPVHAYWDDYWSLRGIRDAIDLAREINHQDLVQKWTDLEKDFQKTLFASIRTVIEERSLSYVPASADLGDPDASATAIAISLLGKKNELPAQKLIHTFEDYNKIIKARRAGTWTGGEYTAYEIRLVESLMRSGQKKEALAAFEFYLSDQRPPAWNQWPEKTMTDRNSPTDIGDLPHTWIVSEYVKAMRSLFVYEINEDQSLVLGDGISWKWLSVPLQPSKEDLKNLSSEEPYEPLKISNLPTYYGILNLSLVRSSPRRLASVSDQSQKNAQSPQQDSQFLKIDFQMKNPKKGTTFRWRAPIGCQIQKIVRRLDEKRKPSSTETPGVPESSGEKISPEEIIFNTPRFNAEIQMSCEI